MKFQYFNSQSLLKSTVRLSFSFINSVKSYFLKMEVLEGQTFCQILGKAEGKGQESLTAKPGKTESKNQERLKNKSQERHKEKKPGKTQRKKPGNTDLAVCFKNTVLIFFLLLHLSPPDGGADHFEASF